MYGHISILHIVTIVYITLDKVYVVGHRTTIMSFLVSHTGDTLIIKYDNSLIWCHMHEYLCSYNANLL